MGEHGGGVGERILVADAGRWYDAGAIVRVERAPSEPGQLRLVPDGRGDREVLGCRRTVMNDRPMLVVTVRRV